MRLPFAILVIGLSTAGAARADCRAGSTIVLSCMARGGTKALDVCIDTATSLVSYSYGAPDRAPELILSQPVSEIEHHPWPGIGRSIWETTVFHNAGYAYEVFTSVDRMTRDEPATGGVILQKNDETIARIDCDAGTVEFGLWALSDAKEAAGLCWNQSAESWNACTQ